MGSYSNIPLTGQVGKILYVWKNPFSLVSYLHSWLVSESFPQLTGMRGRHGWQRLSPCYALRKKARSLALPRFAARVPDLARGMANVPWQLKFGLPILAATMVLQNRLQLSLVVRR